MLHRVILFNKKWQNLPTLVISYKVIRGTNIFLIRYDENLHFQSLKKNYITFIKINSVPGPNLAKNNNIFFIFLGVTTYDMTTYG